MLQRLTELWRISGSEAVNGVSLIIKEVSKVVLGNMGFFQRLSLLINFFIQISAYISTYTKTQLGKAHDLRNAVIWHNATTSVSVLQPGNLYQV